MYLIAQRYVAGTRVSTLLKHFRLSMTLTTLTFVIGVLLETRLGSL
jgi:hypothetical protein